MGHFNLSLIIPTYNELDNLPELYRRIQKLDISIEIIIVDDNSPDGTGQLADQISSEDQNVTVIHRPGKLGLSSAVIAGLNISKGQSVAVIDADLQHPPEILLQMVKRLESGFQIVVASRYVEGGGIIGWSFSRNIVSKIARLAANLLIHQSRRVKDPMSGFFAVNRQVLDGVTFNHLGFKILLEVLAKAKYSSVTEVPYVFTPRLRGTSKLRSSEVYAYLKLLLTLFFNKT